MCEALVQCGKDVTVIHPRRRQIDPGLRDKTIFDYYGLMENFTVKTLPYLDVYPLQRMLPAKMFTLLHNTVDAVWSVYAATVARNLKADMYLCREVMIAWWLTRFGLPIVFDAHRVPKRAQRLLLRQIAKHRDLVRVTTVTSWIRDRFIEVGFDENLVTTLPNAMDPVQFRSTPTTEACRQRLGLPADRPIVGYIGRFSALRLEKGIPALIEAVGRIKRQGQLKPLLLCVGGPMDVVPRYREVTRREGLTEDEVIIIDRVPNTEVQYWMKSCDVVTVPWSWTEFSAYETSPMKLFEYMAVGVPIVASDLPSIRDILTHQYNAILVSPGDPVALADGIGQVLSDRILANRISSQAHRDVQNNTWKQRAKAVLTAASRKF